MRTDETRSDPIVSRASGFSNLALSATRTGQFVVSCGIHLSQIPHSVWNAASIFLGPALVINLGVEEKIDVYSLAHAEPPYRPRSDSGHAVL